MRMRGRRRARGPTAGDAGLLISRVERTLARGERMFGPFEYMVERRTEHMFVRLKSAPDGKPRARERRSEPVAGEAPRVARSGARHHPPRFETGSSSTLLGRHLGVGAGLAAAGRRQSGRRAGSPGLGRRAGGPVRRAGGPVRRAGSPVPGVAGCRIVTRRSRLCLIRVTSSANRPTPESGVMNS